MHRLGILPLILYLTACGTPFLQKEQISSLVYPPGVETRIIFYRNGYELEGDGTCLVREHRLIRTGSNILSAPQWFAVADNPTYQLKKFNARIIHADGRTEKYNRGVLNKANLSNAQIISAQDVYYMSIVDELQSNDILEMVAVHKNMLLPLGLDFSLGQLPYAAANISCDFQVKDGAVLNYVVKNDSINPQVITADGISRYLFRWSTASVDNERPVFQFKNRRPLVLVQGLPVPASDPSKGWVDFGNWYLDLIRHRLEIPDEIRKLALEITAAVPGQKEKLDALFRYSQKNYRYEQSYLEFGEFIPNDVKTILAHGYGDCKDYSLLIYLLGRSLDIPCDLALCYRGRGYEFFSDVAVNQFNHMIVHYADSSGHYWYDGTNRFGLPGLTSDDLINQPALVLLPDKSELITIRESPLNLLKITGEFIENKNSFSGDLYITLSGQYAIKFFFMYNYFNEMTIRENLYKWCRKNIHSDLNIRGISWTVSTTDFTIRLNCEIVNALVDMTEYKSFYMQKVLNCLLPLYSEDLKNENLDYYPAYNRVNIRLNINNLATAPQSAETGQVEACRLELNYSLPPGPFNISEREKFIADYRDVVSRFKAKTKLYAGGVK